MLSARTTMQAVLYGERRQMTDERDNQGSEEQVPDGDGGAVANFAALGLRPELARAAAAMGWAAPTEIQQGVIPLVLRGHDVVGVAQTGTGKTAAFVLPILDRLAEMEPAPALNPYCVVLGPTRELAQQTAEQFAQLGRGLKPRVLTAYGGTSDRPQTTALAEGVEIIVGAPGRVLDLMRQGYLQYEQLVFLVLDEADRMFDMGFIDEVKNILNRMPARRQTLMFSATIPPQVKRLAQDYLIYPEEVRLGPTAPPAALVHEVWPLSEEQKYDALRGLLRSDVQSAVVFCRTKKGASQLAQQLGRAGFNVAAIHADRLQRDRERALARFKAGEVRVLVATDVASRGLDVEGLDLVVNFDVPRDAEDYVHRVGRTARVDRPGLAVTLMTRAEERYLQRIEKYIGEKIARGGPGQERQPRSSEKQPAPAEKPPADERRPRKDKEQPKTSGRRRSGRQSADKPRGKGGSEPSSADRPRSGTGQIPTDAKTDDQQPDKPRRRRGRRGGRGRGRGPGSGKPEQRSGRGKRE